jgi:hypothetical protein
MKNYIKSQIMSFLVFSIIYAGVRLLLAGPMMSQNWDMLAIVISSVGLAWLIIRHFFSKNN